MVNRVLVIISNAYYRVKRLALLGLLGLVLAGLVQWAGPVAAFQARPPGSRVYTFDGDFNQGALISVNHDPPNNHQLQLNRTAAPLPFLNIAASARGTVIRINLTTETIVGEYWTAPQGMGRNPSRTTVDRFGNVWVTNRAEGSGGKGSVTRIGLIIGGTRVNAAGRPEMFGEYLKPPFQYNTCVDRNRDNLIRTSRSRDDIHHWTNAGDVDRDGGVETADDECIINFTRVNGTFARTVAVDPNNDVWVGGDTTAHEKISGLTGLPVPGTQFELGCGGYGGLVDPAGVLWSARWGQGLLRYDTKTEVGKCLGETTGNYGLGVDPRTRHIWHSSLGEDPKLFELDPSGAPVNVYPQPFEAQGVVVDANSHVWVAELFGSRVWHLAPNPATPGRHLEVGIVEGFQGVTGVAVDLYGMVWAPELNGNSVSRINPRLGGRAGGGYTIGAIERTIDLGAGAGPYNYSDMTGFVAIGVTAPQGTWSVVHDSGVEGTQWGRIIWNTEPQASEPPGSSITVEARAAATETGLTSQPFSPIRNNIAFGLTGRFIEVRAALRASPDGVSPVLSDLSIQPGTPEPTPSATTTPTASATPTPTPTATPTPTVTLTSTLPPTSTPTPSLTSTLTATPTVTSTATPPPPVFYLYLPFISQVDPT